MADSPVPIPGLDVVAIAGSAGGFGAIRAIVEALPAAFPTPVILLQHRPESLPGQLEAWIARRAHLTVRTVSDGEPLASGTVHVCPGGRNVTFEAGRLCVHQPCPAGRPRPSADVLFGSLAPFGPRALAVVLTGRGRDGAGGCAEVRRAGGIVAVQDPASCVAAAMPEAVLARCGADFVLPPRQIARAMVALAMAPAVSAALFALPRQRASA